MRLNPIPPAHYLNRLGYAYSFLGRYEHAIEIHKEVLKRTPDNLHAQVCLTAAYSALGREDEARHQAEELLGLEPAFSLEQYAEILPMMDKAAVERYIANLRKAGLK